jgi:hypothetical protein
LAGIARVALLQGKVGLGDSKSAQRNDHRQHSKTCEKTLRQEFHDKYQPEMGRSAASAQQKAAEEMGGR